MIDTTDHADTKSRILDAAEQLFANNGIDATSLRSIIAEAGVNLAAVHYHFGSKEQLLRSVLGRRLRPINEQRLAALAEAEQEAANEPIAVGKLVEIFFAPMVELAEAKWVFGILLGRVLAEPEFFFGKVAPEEFKEVRQAFRAAFQESLPELPEDELFWRLMLGIGAAAHIFRAAPFMPQLSDGVCNQPTKNELLGRLVHFVGAGLQAPLGEVSR